MRIGSSGYVGIGTSTPLEKFVVNGNSLISGTLGVGSDVASQRLVVGDDILNLTFPGTDPEALVVGNAGGVSGYMSHIAVARTAYQGLTYSYLPTSVNDGVAYINTFRSSDSPPIYHDPIYIDASEINLNMSVISGYSGGKVNLTRTVYQNLTSGPSSPVEGEVYYDSTLSKLQVYTGSDWETISSSVP